MSAIDQTPPPPTPVAAKPSTFQRFAGVLFAPAKTFEDIARRPNILGPLIVIVIISIIGAIVVTQTIDFNDLARQSMEMQPKRTGATEKSIEQGERFMAAIMKASAYASPILNIVVLLVFAAIFLAAYRIMGGEGDFVQYLSTTLYAWTPYLIVGPLSWIVFILRKGKIDIYQLQSPLRSNLGFLVTPTEQPVAFAMLSSIDVFTIWVLILFVIGFAAVAKVSKTKSAAIVLVLWGITRIFVVGGAAFQALMKAKQG